MCLFEGGEYRTKSPKWINYQHPFKVVYAFKISSAQQQQTKEEEEEEGGRSLELNACAYVW